jgi:hypothetical protein
MKDRRDLLWRRCSRRRGAKGGLEERSGNYMWAHCMLREGLVIPPFLAKLVFMLAGGFQPRAPLSDIERPNLLRLPTLRLI